MSYLLPSTVIITNNLLLDTRVRLFSSSVTQTSYRSRAGPGDVARIKIAATPGI